MPAMPKAEDRSLALHARGGDGEGGFAGGARAGVDLGADEAVKGRRAMRHLAIGDIHGCFRALTTLEAFVPFRDEDTLITLGDYVDRGPNSCAVLDWLVARRAEGATSWPCGATTRS